MGGGARRERDTIRSFSESLANAFVFSYFWCEFVTLKVISGDSSTGLLYFFSRHANRCPFLCFLAYTPTILEKMSFECCSDIDGNELRQQPQARPKAESTNIKNRATKSIFLIARERKKNISDIILNKEIK